jgi:hypothetical protein
MLTKAKAMCTANGVKFDESVFTSMFNSAKSLAVASAATGSETYTTTIEFSSSTLDTQGLINTFTSEFKTNYSNWIENQKAKAKQ